MSTVSTETTATPTASGTAHYRPARRAWLEKAVFALLDQGLIGASNFIVGILLARRISAAEYGAYALAYECFLVLSVIYSALILEPMTVFGPSVYRDVLPRYLRVLLHFHVRLAIAIVLVLGAGAALAHELGRSSLAHALLGTCIAAPLVLFFWLARRGFYLNLAARPAAAGSVIYCAVMLSGAFTVYKLHLLSPLIAFVLMALAALVTSPLMWLRLKSASPASEEDGLILEVRRRHWNYGRWALASSVVSWSSGNVCYVLLAIFGGLAATGSLKALLNVAAPAGQVLAAFSMLSLPYAARLYRHEGTKGVKLFSWKLTCLYAGAAVAFWAIVLSFRSPAFALLYGGKYMAVIYLLPGVALASTLRMATMGQSLALRAIHLPRLVFVMYASSTAALVVIGIPAILAYGLAGAVLAPIASNAISLILGFVLLHRAARSAPVLVHSHA